MPHHSPLVATIVGAIVLAFLLGALAQRLKLSPLVGYLIAGVLCGPFTPGFTADPDLALELAEIGVILLMFGVGLHFSLADLLSVKAIAIPGAVVQIAVATVLGIGLAHLLGWSFGGGLVFGLALSVASTVVLLRALQERRILESEQGRVAVGWLIVEDLAMVLALVLLPALSEALGGRPATATATTALVGGDAGIAVTLAITLGKVVAFIALMLIVGRRVIPWVLHWVAHRGSRELFRLAVLAIALGVAFGSAMLFDVSFALGAFFAGMVLSESPLSQRAAEETLPLRDAFAVMFFVSVGMLVDPSIIWKHPLELIATLLIVVVGKSMAAFALVRLFGYGNATALTISASLAQVGEFSFILAALGVSLDLLPAEGRDLILAAAIFSIVLNPFFFLAIDKLRPYLVKAAPTPEAAKVPALPQTEKTEHTILVGYGRVGRLVAAGLETAGTPFVVIEDQEDAVESLKKAGIEVVNANAAALEALVAANIAHAKRLILAIPDGFAAVGVLKKARTLNPKLDIIARAHSDAEVERLKQGGASFIIMGEREVARGMLGHVFGLDKKATSDAASGAAAEVQTEEAAKDAATRAIDAVEVPLAGDSAPDLLAPGTALPDLGDVLTSTSDTVLTREAAVEGGAKVVVAEQFPQDQPASEAVPEPSKPAA
ncbi:Kef family K(+) transporter [Aquabacter sp. L1I39]|uniref:YbaL family putative K(+) efflux transporter n=1 Tax=Aquabacter sp. L1I39 TaxID=2820278 RepID=UPI001ADA3F41|nr:YbaL family putative K(+) efflux transporter [Aquabacter sp. L1I39]QTL04344.1 Kef family K(+) transporter [Aquabacter sp. L1I39]